jgi:sulfatase maturation enzyme AslB (radical SAM superfamily)
MSMIQDFSSRAACRVVGGVYDWTAGPFPAVVRIETTNACNARCTICPHQRMTRPVATMDEGLFRRIVDECAAWGCREIHLHNFGEPLLDRRLEDRVAYAKDQGIAKLKVFSNGSLLTEERARGLVEAGLDEIKVSFDGASREEFEDIRRPLKFDRVVENIARLVEIRNAAGSKPAVLVACCSTSDKTGTMQKLERMVDGFSFGRVHNWGGEEFAERPQGVRKTCSRLWRTFTVLSDGRVALCCLDYDAQHVLGQMGPDTTIRDVWTGEEYRRVRSLHREARQDEIPLCSRCTKSFF